MKIKKIVWLLLGLVGLGLGALGAGAASSAVCAVFDAGTFSFGKSSEKLHSWFTGIKALRG